MNKHDEGIALIVAVVVVSMTLIMCITTYEMHRASLNAQVIPQVVIETETP